MVRQYYQDYSVQYVDDFDFRYLFKLDLELVLHICRAILLEKKVIIIKKDTSNLAEIIQTLLSLVQPFTWNFPIIADLPRSMLEALEGVQPFIIGIERDLWLSDCVVQRMDNRGEENFAICDMDSGESRGLHDLYDDGTPHVEFPKKALAQTIKNFAWMINLKDELIDRLIRGKSPDNDSRMNSGR